MSQTDLIQRCQAVLNQHAKSFRWASYFLPRRMRRDAALAYAFCRLVDDTADETPSVHLAREELNRLEGMLLGALPRAALVAAFVEMCEQRHIGLVPALDLIAGARSDLGLVRIRDDGELHQYCYRVAGTVGLMMCGILGVTDPRARQHAVDLGVAMQITNICRDVVEDARRDRIYLPQTRLKDENLSPRAVMQGTARELPSGADHFEQQLASVVIGLLAEADTLYQSGTIGTKFLKGRVRLAILIASSIYREIGVRLRSRYQGNVLRGRVVVPAGRKLALTLRSCLQYWTRRGDSTVPGQPEPHLRVKA